jgi:replicative DNA helicase
MTISLEKVYFAYIIKNKRYFEVVEPTFFKNTEIQFVYTIIRKYILKNVEADMPQARQIYEMISLEDRDGLITKEIFRAIMTTNLSEYDEINFIIPNFKSWILSNRLKSGTVEIIDETRNLDSVNDFEQTVIAANKIRSIADEMSRTNFVDDDGDLGSDFDEAENHTQDSSRYKVRSGFGTIDHMLGGGFDIGSLTILMAETNVGKSLWMQNLAVSCANLGYNVLYITLEMSERKVIKRLGAMRLKIPINDYDNVSKDTDEMKRKIDNLINTIENSDDLFEKKVGKIFTKFWPAGTANVNDFDNFINKLQIAKKVKIDVILIDYLSLMIPPKSSSTDSLYVKGKLLAEGVRALGHKYSCPVISAVQVAKDAWNSKDISLESVPESKAIPETSDVFFVIIRTEEMKRQNLYRLKLLKQRDGDFLKSQVKISLDTNFLLLNNDVFIDSI